MFDNVLTVQFEHRMTAYALFVLAALHAIDAVRSRAGSAASGALWLFAAVSLQAVLGILTLLNQVPIGSRARASGGRDRRCSRSR